MEIPYRELAEETLQRLIESFVLREGTDYGHSDYSLEDKVERVKRQLSTGAVVIVFDPETESVNILTRRELQQRY